MLDQQTLATIFKLSPSPSLILRPDAPLFTVADVNEAYLEKAMITRDELIGKSFFDYFKRFPGQDMSNDADALERALKSKKETQTNVNVYQFPLSGGIGHSSRYFRATNVPVLSEDGEVIYMIHAVTEHTETEMIRYLQENTLRDLQEASLLMDQGQELANFGNWHGT